MSVQGEQAAAFAGFAAAAQAAGFAEVVERVWPADALVPEHTHPFAVAAQVVAGEMWLTVAGETRHLLPGDRFSLVLAEPHAERYGPVGATYWVARRG
ncbi:MAG: hypothetical protein RIR00_2178 [Pseudomonadota bacterium]|jgi:hypothetical protein